MLAFSLLVILGYAVKSVEVDYSFCHCQSDLSAFQFLKYGFVFLRSLAVDLLNIDVVCDL